MPFRVEISPNNRATCKNKECKDNNVKIMKGELRYATQITVQEHTSWTYKHWGCVTPVQIANLIESTDGDTDMVDGYDELPAEFQEKIDFALKHGHVPDEDWKGDVEVNRPGQKGFRAKAQSPKKKKGKKADQDEDADEEPKPKKKRGRAAKDDEDNEDVPVPKKAKGKAKKTATKEEDGEVDEIKSKKAAKKASAKEDDIKEDKKTDNDAPKSKKERGTKGAIKEANPRTKRSSAKVAYVEDETDDEETEAPKAKKTAPQKRGRKKKVVEDE